MFIVSTITRFLVAGVIPFLCIFSQTLLQYNFMFALGGMVGIVRQFIGLSFDFDQVNHTLADLETLEEWDVSILCSQFVITTNHHHQLLTQPEP